jgi:hypothetical protein
MSGIVTTTLCGEQAFLGTALDYVNRMWSSCGIALLGLFEKLLIILYPSIVLSSFIGRVCCAIPDKTEVISQVSDNFLLIAVTGLA